MKLIFWTGTTSEKWSPMDVESGLGGSETAVARVAEGLASRGHEVVVVGRVRRGAFGGVDYDDESSLRHHLPCDVFVSSRDARALARLRPKCERSVLWVHDLGVGSDPEGGLRRYDAIVCPSFYSQNYLRIYYDVGVAKMAVVIPHGVEPSYFLREGETAHDLRPVEKVGNLMVYSSSPDRGLDRLLDLWPDVKEICPTAQLGVYYGFAGWEASIAARGRSSPERAEVDFLKARLASMRKDDVVFYGRVGQREVAEAFLRARLWLYPTSFCETFCITALEAMAGGAWPVTSGVGSLPETISFGTISCGTIVSEHPLVDREKFHLAFLRGVEEALTGDLAWKADRTRARVLQEETWDASAAAWDRFLGRLVGRSS